MGKKVMAVVKLQCPAGQANPAPPVGPALGQHGVNIMEFCKAFNAKTQDKNGLIIPAEITIYQDPLHLRLEVAPGHGAAQEGGEVEEGLGEPNRNKVGKVTKAQLLEIVEMKKDDSTRSTPNRPSRSSPARRDRWAWTWRADAMAKAS